MPREIKPIRTEDDHAAAMAEIETLWNAIPGSVEDDRLDVLVTLVDAYENEHDPMDPPDPIEAIKFRMEQQGLTRKDLEAIIGTRTRITEVLSGKRGLSITMIRPGVKSLAVITAASPIGPAPTMATVSPGLTPPFWTPTSNDSEGCRRGREPARRSGPRESCRASCRRRARGRTRPGAHR